MIIRPFAVPSQGQVATLTDVLLLDNPRRVDAVNALISQSIGGVQQGALCQSRGLPNRSVFDNRFFAVSDAGNVLIGVWMLGLIEYVSGPWADLVDFEVTSPGAPIMLSGIPMTGIFSGVTATQEARFGRDVAAYLLDPASPLVTGEGRELHFDHLHYALFKSPTGAEDIRAQLHHSVVVADSRFDVTEAAHPSIAGLTLVELRWAG